MSFGGKFLRILLFADGAGIRSRALLSAGVVVCIRVCKGIVDVLSVSLYIHQFAAFLADVVAFAGCRAGRLVVGKLFYAFHIRVVAVVCILPFGCKLAVERMGNLGNGNRNGHCLSVRGIGVNDFSLFGTARLFGHFFFDVGYIRILTDLRIASVAGDSQSKACSVLIGNKLPIFIMSESGDFFGYFRVAHRAVTFLFAFRRAGGL